MRALAFLGLFAMLGGTPGFDDRARSADDARDDAGRAILDARPRFADLQTSAAGLFLKLVNDALRGRIDPRAVTFRAPAGLTLEDLVLSDPRGAPVARVKRIDVALDLRALLSGEIAISRLDAVEPRLLLEVADGKLNLLEALSPRKKPDPSSQAKGGFRIDDIRVRDGGFRLRDGENITITADDIDAVASLDVDLAHEAVHVDVRNVAIATAGVRLKELDLPLRDVRARRIDVLSDLIKLVNVSASALGGPDGAGPRARLVVDGTVRTTGDGELRLNGDVDAAAGAWPDRLTPLAFGTPSLRAKIAVGGPFADPVVDVDGDFGVVDLYGYRLDGGSARVFVNKRKVVIAEGTVGRIGRGSIRVAGDVRFADQDAPTTLDLRTRLDDVALSQVLSPAKLDTTLRGSLSASARITGRADGDRTEVVIAGNVGGRGLSLYDVSLPVEVDGDVRVVVTPRRVDLARVRLLDPLGTFEADVAGTIATADETLDLSIVVGADDVNELVPAIPGELVTRHTDFRGRISGPYARVVVEGDVAVDRGEAWGVPLSEVSARVRVTGDEVRVDDGRGMVAGGTLSQPAPLRLALGRRARTFGGGVFAVKNASIAALRTPSGDPLPLSGRLDLEARLAGSTAQPRVSIRAAAGGLVVSDEPLGTARAAFVATKDALEFSLVEVAGPAMTARGSGLRLATDTLRLTGIVDVAVIDLARIEHARRLELRGRGKGIIRIDGDVRAPKLQADLVVRGLQMSGWSFGDGSVAVGLAPEAPASGSGDGARARALVATVAARTGWELGRYDVRAAWSIEREVLSADVHAADVDLSLLAPYTGSAAPTLAGAASINAAVSGTIDALSGHIKVSVRDVAVARGAITAAAPAKLRPLGGLVVDAHLDAGALTAKICAFADPAARGSVGPGTCLSPQRLQATIAGRIAPGAGAYALAIDANVDEDRIEDLVPALAAREIALAAWLRVNARLDKPAGGEAQLSLSMDVRDLIVRAAGAPTLRLQRATRLRIADRRATIVEQPARFVTARDDVDVVIAAGSSVGADDIDLVVDGDLALSALKLLTNEIANAAGTANTHLRVSGRFDDGVRIAGALTPQVGARLTLRTLGQAIVFESGTIEFSPDEQRPELLRVAFSAPCDSRRDGCPLKAMLGEGRVQLKGDVLARTSRTPDQPWIERFDLALSGTGLEWRGDVGRLEASCDLALQGEASGPVLTGRVEVSDGLLRRDFELRNFVLSQTPEAPTDPMWRRMTPYGLGALTFDVEASMQNVRTKARINAFSVDASLRGELRLGRSLKLPSLDGTVEVEEGTVEFPRARFDIVEMQVQFPTSSEGRLQPLVHLAARTDLPPNAAGNDVEVPVDLTIDGTFDAMQLSLSAVDEKRQWSRTELMAFILFGTVPADTQGTLVGASVAIAQRAALRELAAPVSAQIEQFVGNAGLDFNIDVVSGWQLELGRRLVLEGQGLLTQQLGATDSTTTTTTTGTTGTDALRVRLLLYDHLPLGRSLSAEGRFGTTSDLRLSWRLYEE